MLDELLPKKEKLVVAKWRVPLSSDPLSRLRLLTASRSANHLNLVVVNSAVLFFNIRDGPYFPTLRVLHQCATAALRANVPQHLLTYSRPPQTQR